MFTWKDGVGADHVAAAEAALAALCGVVPGIVSFRYGSDVGINPANADFAIVADFESADRYVGYRDHPEHQAFVANFVVDHAASRTAVQFEL